MVAFLESIENVLRHIFSKVSGKNTPVQEFTLFGEDRGALDSTLFHGVMEGNPGDHKLSRRRQS
jgi:hypothetical protein